MSEWGLDSPGAVEYLGTWGRIMVEIDGVDRTFYRDMPTIVESWSSGEPFSDKTARIVFPAVTSFESVDDLPFDDFDDVNLWLVNDSGTKIKKLWEGFIGAATDDLEPSSNGLTIECVGALYQADLFIKPPGFGFQLVDSGFAIANAMNLRASEYGLRFKQMNWLTWSSNATRNLGSWNPLLTGWAQELLSESYTPAFMSDGETAWAISCSEDGYWVTGDHGTFCSFGDRMPNHGSSTWWNAIFIHLFNDEGLYVTDTWYDKDRKEAYYLSRDGHVGRRINFKSDTPGFDPWYGEPAHNADKFYIAMHGTENMLGYRLLNAFGEVRCFGNASFHGNGPALGTATFTNGQSFPDIYVDMAPTPSGNGYWLLTWSGRIFAFGDATPFADFPLYNDVWVGIAAKPSGTGLWGLDTLGRVIPRGTAIDYGDPSSSDPGTLARAWRDIDSDPNGGGYVVVRSDGYVKNYGFFDAYDDLGHALFSTTPGAGGNVTQHTMDKLEGRRPVIRTKDTWTEDWVVSCGTPGVSHSITRDRTVMPNVFFGEGTDGNNCKWRNTKYPRYYPGESGTVPVWPGYTMTVRGNFDAPAVEVWEHRMLHNGWPIRIDGIFTEHDANLLRVLQSASGIPVTGALDAISWTATFTPGGDASSLEAAYIAPLVADTRVEPKLYWGNGAERGSNPNYDPSIMRVETYNNYGEKSSKREAIISAHNEMKRNAEPGFFGTITLAADPEGGVSRFEIVAGENILYKNYRGQDILFHIAGVEVDLTEGTVTLTVDSKARDLMNVAAMLSREREIGEIPLQPTRPAGSSSKIKEDTNVVFDCESKAGFVPLFISPALQWTVLRLPLGEVGTCVKTVLTTINPTCAFSVAVFDQEITSNTLGSIGDPEVPDYWKEFPEDKGLIISWGGDGQMCGFYPGRESDDDAVTGRFVDASSWNFWSKNPPWIWVGIWTLQTCGISGRFYPGPDAGFNFASLDSIANPYEIRNTNRPTPAYYGDYP